MGFRITKKPKGDSCATISIRLDKELLAKYDELASVNGRTRTEVVVAALEYALSSMNDDNEDDS